MLPLGRVVRTSYHSRMNHHYHTHLSRNDPDRVGLGTNLRLRAFRRITDEIGTAEKDSKSVYVQRYLCGNVINVALFGIRTHLGGFAKIEWRSLAK
jgi:hypothetical protein